ncbi:hypothetical protein COCOBI_15-2250 [Coccomyxa sp. Obi]|nr:hypothetical protein COCOBI_15-2250 [Coccomyxa sp. Obi]
MELPQDVPYGSQQRRDLETQATRGMLAHFAPHVRGILGRGTPGAADRRLELWFDTIPEAVAARHSAAEDQLVLLEDVPGTGTVAVPVQLTAGRLHCQHTCVIIHGLPYEYSTEGLTQTLLDCAGRERDTYVLRGEFLGDLSLDLAAGSPLVGSGKACLAYIQTPDDDRHLSRLPKYFYIDGDIRINVTRPGHLRQPSQPASFQVEQAAPQLAARTGPRPIRQRQRAAKALSRGACGAALSPASTQLQELEARVRSSRAPGSARTSLGCTAATRPRSQGPSFHAARDTQPAIPMDCHPPAGAQVLSPLAHRPVDMDVDVEPPLPHSPMDCDPAGAAAGTMPPGSSVQTASHPPADVAMDCDCPPLEHTATPAPGVTQHGTSSQPPLELSGVPSTRIEECLSWLAGHTDFDSAQATAAIRALYDRMPLLFQAGDSARERTLIHEGLCHVLRSTHGADSLPQDAYGSPPLTAAELAELLTPTEPATAPAQGEPLCTDEVPTSVALQQAAEPPRQQLRPAIPPGFEERAEAIQTAQQAAQDALAGITPRRRSGRTRQQRTDWWMPPEPMKPQLREHRNRTPQEHRNRNLHQTEGTPARRPSQP